MRTYREAIGHASEFGDACIDRVERASLGEWVVAVLSSLIAKIRVGLAPAENLLLAGIRRSCIRRSEIRFLYWSRFVNLAHACVLHFEQELSI